MMAFLIIIIFLLDRDVVIKIRILKCIITFIAYLIEIIVVSIFVDVIIIFNFVIIIL